MTHLVACVCDHAYAARIELNVSLRLAELYAPAPSTMKLHVCDLHLTDVFKAHLFGIAFSVIQ